MEYDGYGVMVVLATISFILLHLYHKIKYGHWARQNVPHLKSRMIFGSFTFTGKPLQEVECEAYNKYGRLYGRYDGETAVLTVAEPSLLKRILVKDFHLFMNRRDMRFNDRVMDNTLFALEGDDWKRVRSVVSPTLTSAKLKRMLPLMEDCTNVLLENIAKATEEKKSVDCQRLFGAYTIDTIAKCAFGMTINSLLSEDDPFVDKAKRLLDCCLGWRTVLTMVCPRIMKWFRFRLLNPETTEFYQKVIHQLVEERKKIRGREDFLQLLLDSQNDTQDQNNNDIKSKCVDASYTKDSVIDQFPTTDTKTAAKGLSRDEFIAQCVTFFMAGYDSTTSLLSYAIYNLAVNPDYQQRVVEEMESVLQKHDGVLNYECLSELKFMEAVLNECLRLCPSMVRNERRVEEDCYLGDTNIKLNKGMLISIPVYAIHRDPEWYPEPDSFKPERFYESDPNRPQYVHLPFGAGPRLCVGLRFVQMQVKLCLAKVLLRFHALPSNNTPANLGLREVRNVLKLDPVEISLVERYPKNTSRACS